MKLIRSLSALLLSVFFLAAACTALADAPSLIVEAPEIPIPGGAAGELLVTPSVPGFLDVTLTAEKTGEAIQLYRFQEIHTNLNELQFSTLLEPGMPMPEGVYTLTASMVDQFGTPSAPVTGTLMIGPAPKRDGSDAEDTEDIEDTVDAEDAENIEDAVDAEDTVDVEDAVEEAPEKVESNKQPDQTEPKDDKKDKDDSKSDKPSKEDKKDSSDKKDKDDKKKPESDVMAYQNSTAIEGPEGYQIGAGVSDVFPQENAGYWGLTASSSDEDIWKALTQTMVGINAGETESAYIYDSTGSGRERIGTVSGISQGLNVLKDLDNNWSLVEAFRNEDGAFVRGYIRTNKLRVTEPNLTYGIVIDKASQKLIVYKDGERLGSCDVSTGLPTPKTPHRETPAGEYITVTRRGTTEYYGMGYSKYTIRISDNYHLCEIPTKRKNSKQFDMLEDSLGMKATRGNICLPHEASADGGINAEWIWDMTDKNKRVKVLIFDDKPRTAVPVSK